MNRQPGPSRSAAAHTTGSNQYSNPYGEGAPNGDPFNVPSLPVGQSFLMHAPLGMDLLRLRSNTPRAFRSTLLDASQAFPRHGAALNHGRTASKAWKVRLASTAGLPLNPEAQQKMKVLEILKPAWRLESYSRLIHAMQDFGVDGTSAEESNIYHRVGVGRASDRIPRYAPYNFGISPQ
ncbi:hypothetical protein B0H13DRAFT_2366962 [Mycena leptocephala]|nr:hypothetical protein B0H13DRAFT_2366962 [Mycena leptocephala]